MVRFPFTLVGEGLAPPKKEKIAHGQDGSTKALPYRLKKLPVGFVKTLPFNIYGLFDGFMTNFSSALHSTFYRNFRFLGRISDTNNEKI